MATIRAKTAISNLGKSRTEQEALEEAGYSPSYARSGQIKNTKGFKELMDEFLPDTLIAQRHQELLNSTEISHMVFPLGPRTNKQKKTLDALPKKLSTILDAEMQLQETELSDEDIVDLLKTVSCTVKKIVHGETARHVYFWSADSRARKDGLDMAYKIKGAYAPEKSINLNVEANVDSEEIIALANQLNETQKSID